MKLSHKLVLTYGMLFMIAIACAIMLFWSATASMFYTKRADLAHRSYEAHLTLSNATYQLLKEYNDNLLIGDNDQGIAERQLLQNIHQQFAHIRSIIDEEIHMVGEEETEELQELEKLEKIVQNVIQKYQHAQRTFASANHANGKKNLTTQHNLSKTQHTLLVALLDGEFEAQINNAINHALEEEQSEVIETRELTKKMLNNFYNLSIFLAMLAVLILIIAMFIVFDKINKPLQSIINGAKRFTVADWQHRIQVNVAGELKDVADTFNNTAQIAGMREKSLEQNNQKLEMQVQERTAELRATLLDLEGQNMQRQRLLADVSHELRTPLTIIRGEVDVTLRGKEKPLADYKDALQRIGEAAQHTNALVDDVLFIARKEAGKSRLLLAEHDLVTIIQECMNIFHRQFVQNNIALNFNKQSNTAVLSCDKKRIRQVLLILLENILNHGVQASAGRITLTKEADGYELTVSDNGVGISKQEQSKVFERFFRGSNASERYASGTGLGLPVAKAIIEAHHGSISVSSELGEGTNFVVKLPEDPEATLDYPR